MVPERRATEVTATDEEMLRALHTEHGGALFAFALRLTSGDRQRAEDLVQETLLRAWQHPEALDPARGSVRAIAAMAARRADTAHASSMAAIVRHSRTRGTDTISTVAPARRSDRASSSSAARSPVVPPSDTRSTSVIREGS